MIKLLLLITLSLLLSAGITSATNYYVDFQSGSDSNSGLSTSTPWKHSPGDSGAEGIPASLDLTAGNTYCFKGGVIYQGQIAVDGVGGTSGHPVVLDGECAGFGTGKAKITHSRATSTSWTQCPSAAACGNNPNYAHIYYMTLPANVVTLDPWFENEVLLRLAQDPNSPRAVQWSRTEYYDWVPYAQTRLTGTTHDWTGYIKDSGRFTSSDSSHYNGTLIQVHVSGNTIERMPVAAFYPATDEVSFYLDEEVFYTSGTSYAMLNHLDYLDEAGEFVIDETNDKIYLWPYAGGSPANIRYTTGSDNYVFTLGTKNYITIRDFDIFGIRHGALWGGTSSGPNVYGLIFSGNNIREGGRPSSFSGTIYAYYLFDAAITGNAWYNLRDRRGATLVDGNNVSLSKNTLDWIDGTGLFFMGVTNSLMDGNILTNFCGAHGNGLSAYSGSHNTTFSNNILRVSIFGITWQNSNDITIINNIVDAMGCNGCYLTQGGSTAVNGTLKIIHNTWVGSSYANTISGLSAFPTAIVKNNIFSGSDVDTGPNMNYNCWLRDSTAGPHTAEGDRTEYGGETAVFVNYAGADYRLRETTVCKDNGADVSSYGVTTDIVGTSRPHGLGWDIGAYEYVSGSPTPVNGQCGATQNSCTAGTLNDIADNSTHYLWQCTGLNGGTTASCSLAKPSAYCENTQCESGETCSTCPGDCPTPGGQVCCSGTLYAGNCCSSSDCASGQACTNHQCAQAQTNMLTNGDFESGFTGGRANNWSLATDGSVTYSLSQDAGYQGSAQRIDISVPGTWGLFLYQIPSFELGKTYTWSFWYRTQGGELWTEITNGPSTQRVLALRLPDTSGEWRYHSMNFQYNNSLATQMRFYTNSQGSYWIDDVWLALWFHRSDTSQDGCVDSIELSAFIDLWYLDSSNPTLKELIEAIGLWKKGC